MMSFSRIVSVRGEKERSDKGSVAILVVLGLSTLLGFGAIVTDLGMIFVEKARLQNSMDATVLAGAQELPANPQTAIQVAQAYAQKNGTSLDSVSLSADLKKITVKSHKEIPAYLAKIWGVEENTINAQASAAVLPPTSFTGAVPLSVEKQDFIYGEPYILKSGSWNGDEYGLTRHQGWFGALELSGDGASNYRDDLINGTEETISIGQILEIKHGNMSGPTMDGISTRLAGDNRIPRNTFWDYDRDAPQIIYVPVVEPISWNSNAIHEVKVSGFAAFFLEGVLGNGNDSIVLGRFLRIIVPNSQTGQSLESLRQIEEEMEEGRLANDFGVYTPKLLP